jgi:hypothetical protein
MTKVEALQWLTSASKALACMGYHFLALQLADDSRAAFYNKEERETIADMVRSRAMRSATIHDVAVVRARLFVAAVLGSIED